jgi:putative transposase
MPRRKNKLFNAYAQAVNKRNGRTGALFEGRFREVQVDNESYLLHLCRYIHGNPVKAGLVTTLEEWSYSNYLEWIGARPGTLVDDPFVTDFFPNRLDYKEFVLDYLRGIDELPNDIKQYLFS